MTSSAKILGRGYRALDLYIWDRSKKRKPDPGMHRSTGENHPLQVLREKEKGKAQQEHDWDAANAADPKSENGFGR